MNDEGKPKGIAFIKYSSEEAVTKALEFHETDYGGRFISVRKAGEGKGGKGKKGKGKGMSTERQAAKDGSMVEGTGTKQTFADSDSDDDEKPPPKKAKKAAVEDEEEAPEPKKK